jgi:hypothetical protein
MSYKADALAHLATTAAWGGSLAGQIIPILYPRPDTQWASRYRGGEIAPVTDCPRSGRARVDLARLLLVQFAEAIVTFCNLLPKKHWALCRSLWTHRTVR